jgi:cytoskeletal protein CcmA (bactofilin family)
METVMAVTAEFDCRGNYEGFPRFGEQVMALWKDQSAPARNDAPKPLEPAPRDEVFTAMPEYAPPAYAASRSTPADGKESVIGADLAIEGSITGNGSVRLAGRFTGDVTVDGTVSIEPGAKLCGGVRATSVTIAGELEGNVLQASRVDVLASGALLGDLKADTLTIAAGSRVRGHIDCGAVESAGKSKATTSRQSASTPPSAESAARTATEAVSSS